MAAMRRNQDRATAGRSAAERPNVLRLFWQTVRRAFLEFLTVPTLVIAGFLALALITLWIDARTPGDRSASPGLFSDGQAAREFLGVIASSIITVTSITFSLLLVAVQQGAASLTSEVFDQFLRRRANQLYFGFFIGLALYALIMLASVDVHHRPVYGVIITGLMTMIALYMLILLIYTTIDQMRPVVIIATIRDHTLYARECQRELLRCTRRSPRLPAARGLCLAAERSGFLVELDTAALAKAAAEADLEIVVLASIGDYVGFGDTIAEIRTAGQQDAAAACAPAIRAALVLEEQRDLDSDPAFGIEQLATIAWTSISSAKSDPAPGLLTIGSLRDLLGRWLESDAAFRMSGDREDDQAAHVVYRDNLPQVMMGAFETLAVVASESLQHQCAAEVYRSLANVLDRLPPALQQQCQDLVLRSLSGLGDHILTAELEAALSSLTGAMRRQGRSDCARALAKAQHALAQSVGRLGSRSTRTEAKFPADTGR
jgi:uncharacterized membrane protein